MRSFSKHQRVVSSDEFTQILRRGVCVADGVLVMFAVAEDGSQGCRIGITIPKKVGNAVCRNQWKRLIRESYRTQQEQLPAGIAFVVRPKKGAVPTWVAIQKSIPYLAKKAARRVQA